MLLDLLHLARHLRRSPVSAGAAIVTLSLTLGVGSSIFAVVDAVLLTPPPFTAPEALFTVGETPIDQPTARPRAVSVATFEAWRERTESLARLEAFDGTNLTLTELGATERVSATDVTPGFLTLLGVTTEIGRTFDRDDVGQPVVIISSAFWREKLAADPAVIGRRVVLGGQAHTIVGVLPDRFVFALNACDVWRPMAVMRASEAGEGYRVRVIARLADSVSPVQVASALDDISRASSPPARVVATSVATEIAGDRTRTLGVLSGAAALAILIACTNLAGLVMVRSIDRRRELAVRSALGARGSDIARQLLLEAVAFVAIGTVGGVLLAVWMTPGVGYLALEQVAGVPNREVAVSWRVIGVVAIVAFACAAICGSLPALGARRWKVVDVLRRGATPSMHERTLRRGFVAGQVAMAFVLLVSMALLGRTLLGMLDTNPGFDARNVLTLQLSLPGATYPSRERVVLFYSALQGALQERFGPRVLSIVDEIPLTGDGGRSVVRVLATDAGREAVVRTTGRDYFNVMRIPVVAGRTFDVEDDSAIALRVVISESLAKSVFGFDQVIGRRISVGGEPRAAEIIGVVGEVKHRALDETSLPTVYLSSLQVPSPSSIVVVRSTQADSEVIEVVRQEVARLDRNLPVYNIRSMQDVVAASPGVPERRLLTGAFTGFALLAVVLSTIGLFGVAAHDVACRRAELALRMALGAAPMRILRATVGQGALTVGSGLAVGAVLSIWMLRGLGSVIFTSGQPDVLSIAVAAAVLMATGACAVLPAALRAARTDPVIALRDE